MRFLDSVEPLCSCTAYRSRIETVELETINESYIPGHLAKTQQSLVKAPSFKNESMHNVKGVLLQIQRSN